ncbi:uncharacterized protein MONOS_1201 [Monocercomonoides exilis]|uniref:uncharacterized protein n=1 Tax=Monocercomonoides exilis TaxID=2049356 RepID=UPI0035599752|nr:hypothetical protein MONOS_1201 [Monocercomonoides exilis]|eukprot:MONOS_1201.1-p1 / transcript=MONOS_1201.1 / gene=MONOS_1201 / organism=Monocercomonoides_exilis_PA203 / gene_product=unspecified product / transcript_product=unspecified product / location=Mono_scaffold00020:151810-152504(-) / protein_length=137 / sequence_SO=supercontig / SO=protein_coding / is_pseudo=false
MAYFFKQGTTAVDQGKIWDQMVKTEMKYHTTTEDYTPNPHTFIPYPEKPCNISPKDVMERSLQTQERTLREKERTRGDAPSFPLTSSQMYGFYSTTLMKPDERSYHGKHHCEETQYAQETIIHGHTARFGKEQAKSG